MQKTRKDIHAKFVRYWAKQRKNKFRYVAKGTFFQSLFFSLFMVFFEYKENAYVFDYNVLKSFLILFLISVILWGISIVWQFNLTEKRYQKLIQENSTKQSS